MTSKKRAQDLTSWWVTVCIGKPWALEGQFLWAAKRENPPMGKLFGAVTHLESGLPEFSHLLDQCGRIEEATGGGGVNGSLIKFFHKNLTYVPHSKSQEKNLIRK
jgi:hypothetical protein